MSCLILLQEESNSPTHSLQAACLLRHLIPSRHCSEALSDFTHNCQISSTVNWGTALQLQSHETLQSDGEGQTDQHAGPDQPPESCHLAARWGIGPPEDSSLHCCCCPHQPCHKIRETGKQIESDFNRPSQCRSEGLSRHSMAVQTQHG